MSELAAIVVGAGFSGLCAGVQLRKAGITSFVILEQDDGVGGTWRQNTYPGAACDVPSHLYSYSFEPNPAWSRAYGGQPEILAYLEHVATKYGLREHIRFHSRVDSAIFDEASQTWRVTTSDGIVRIARSLILGNGALHEPAIPELPGLASFAGDAFHSARWRHDIDLAGKRVAVIGTGASAIQFVPELAKRAARVDVYQRTPPWIVPKRDRAISDRERWAFEKLPGAHWLRRTGLYWLFETRVLGFAFAPKVNQLAEKLVLAHLAKSVADPALRARLTPDYRLGCKRVLISNDYYAAMARDNVELITDPIAEVTSSGVRTLARRAPSLSGRAAAEGANAGERTVDAIVFGTGFRVVDYLAKMRIVGRRGEELNETWQRGVRNYLGINVAGFPNLFLLMGPNTGLGHNSMIFMIEAQVHYTVAAIRALHRNAYASLDVRPDAEAAFVAEMQKKLARTVWTSGCSSWYMAPTGEVLLWPGFTFDYWRRTRRIRLQSYEWRALAHTASINADEDGAHVYAEAPAI